MNGETVYVNRHAEWLTSEEINVIKKSCTQVGDAIEMASDFYNRLFYLFPIIRPLFKENIHQQACEFTNHVFIHFKDIENWDDIQDGIEVFRKRYVFNEVNPQVYAYMGEALFYALKNQLKNSWDSERDAAWQKFYRIVVNRLGTQCYDSLHSTHSSRLPLAS